MKKLILFVLGVATWAHASSVALYVCDSAGQCQTTVREVLTPSRPAILFAVGLPENVDKFLARASSLKATPIFWFRDSGDFAAHGLAYVPRPSVVVIGEGALEFSPSRHINLWWGANSSDSFLVESLPVGATYYTHRVSPLCSNAFEIGDLHLNPGLYRF